MLVSLINQIHHHFHHHVLLLCFALCNHQSQGHEGVICQALGSVKAVEYAIVIQKPQE